MKVSHKELRLNYMCYLGAILGLQAIFMHWFHSFDVFLIGLPDKPVSLILSPWHSDWFLWWLRIFSILVVCGTAIAFFSPLGGLLQISGIILFTAKLVEWMRIYRHVEGGVLPGLGAPIALFGAVLMTASIFRSTGMQSKKSFDLRDRLMAARMATRFTDPADHGILHRMRVDWKEYRIALLSGAMMASFYSFSLAGLIPVSDRQWSDYEHLLFLGAALALLAVPCAASLAGNRCG